jgi:RimJ/RimL family protein N-acetyltransferase
MSQAWRSALPILSGRRVTVREICESDAAPLYGATASPELREFVKAPPSSVEGFRRFIAKSRSKRAAGRGGAFAIIPAGDTSPAGLFQINVLEEESGVVEGGFVLAVSLWGQGIFAESATLILDFLFGEVAAERVQGWSALENRRAIQALKKLGAVPGAIVHDYPHFDQPRDGQLWTISAEAWKRRLG